MDSSWIFQLIDLVTLRERWKVGSMIEKCSMVRALEALMFAGGVLGMWLAWKVMRDG